MCECSELEELRVKTRLYHPNHPEESRGHAGWNLWLGKEEIDKTKAFVTGVAEMWREKANPTPRTVSKIK